MGSYASKRCKTFSREGLKLNSKSQCFMDSKGKPAIIITTVCMVCIRCVERSMASRMGCTHMIAVCDVRYTTYNLPLPTYDVHRTPYDVQGICHTFIRPTKYRHTAYNVHVYSVRHTWHAISFSKQLQYI
jgi:hypothetical protein